MEKGEEKELQPYNNFQFSVFFENLLLAENVQKLPYQMSKFRSARFPAGPHLGNFSGILHYLSVRTTTTMEEIKYRG